MKKLRIAVAALVIAAGSFAAFAFTKADVQTEKAPTTYWVTGKVGSNFVVSDNPDDAGDCRGGSEPCEITTTETPNPTTHQLTPAQMASSNTTIISSQNL